MTAGLDGKIAAITGGTQGLGAAIASLFAQRGAAGLVICGRHVEKGQVQADTIAKDTGCAVTFVRADLGSVEACRSVIQAADRTFGRIDVLVNAAGLTTRGTILDTTPEIFDDLFAVNIRAPFFLIQEAVKVMRRESTRGAVVNISSMSALAGQPFIAAYCASKGALDTLTRNTAFALLRNNIRVNGLTSAGWQAKERTASSASSTAGSRTGSKLPPPRSRPDV